MEINAEKTERMREKKINKRANQKKMDQSKVHSTANKSTQPRFILVELDDSFYFVVVVDMSVLCVNILLYVQ